MDEHYNDIDALIAKFLAGEATPEEAMMLHDWTELSEANKKQLEAAEAVWLLDSTGYQKPDTAKLFESFPFTKKRKHVLFTPLRIAASILLLMSISAVLYFFTRPIPEENKNWITKESSQQPLSWQLPEKTTVTLNGKSRIRYPETFESIRKVELSGEAYFEVTPDPLKPFVISVDALEIKVLGTAFDVSAYDADSIVRVQVVHGSVRMKHKTDSLVLKAGQKGLYDKVMEKLWLEQPPNHNNIGYATHTFSYTDIRLEQILHDLEAAYRVTVEVENPQVKNCHLTGEYHSLDLPVILEVISKSLDLTYSINGNRVYISGDGCL